jgi:amino acid transporter
VAAETEDSRYPRTGEGSSTTSAQPSFGYALKRVLLGRPLATDRLAHERLGKPTALAVFSSDNLSSVAYATEEILRVLIPAVGIVAFNLVFPISFSIVVIEAILIFSYRQTIKAYPSAGGAYIVTKDNLGLLPAQLAGVALLVDYVLTVSVSTAAGVEAISSAIPLSVPIRIVLSLAFVWLIAYGNLLGVRESGRIFAVPTYVFIFSLYSMLLLGLYEVAAGHLHPFSLPAQQHQGGMSLGAAAVGLFLVLRAFASGGAAVTGVEAISNGVPAFRRPEWRNAQITLMYMGVILSASFLASSYLAAHLHVVPVADESKSVLAQIAQRVYGSGFFGHSLFLLLQISTTLILVLAANTSFADFPRLASFHAGDAFMPRQLTKRGHKLVFSNGIVALAAAASLVIIVFRASVTNMIPLYALGVFTSFTLSQSGMAKRHLKLREPKWRTGLIINGLGAVSTAVVAVIIAVVKFSKGAWMVMLFVPIMVYTLVRVNRVYENEEEDLLEGLETGEALRSSKQTAAVVLVDAVDEKTLHALQYALTIGAREVRAVHLSTDEHRSDELHQAWLKAQLRGPLEIVPCPNGSRPDCLEAFVRKISAAEEQVTVIVPGLGRAGFVERVGQRYRTARLLDALRQFDNVSSVIVRAHDGMGHATVSGRPLVSPRRRHIVIIMVGRLDRGVLKAVRFARSVGATDVRGVHAATDPIFAGELAEQWMKLGAQITIPLDIEECSDRNIVRTVRRYIDQLAIDDTEVTVIIPRRRYSKIAHRLLHDHTSRAIFRGLVDLPHVDLLIVPYAVGSSLAGPRVQRVS